jgi:flavin-dependent thymidylate synthase
MDVQFIDHAPRVFVAGITMPTFTGTEEYLRYRGETWNSDLVAADPEAIVEAAGRVCYQSWKNPARRTREEYLQEQIIGHAHGCYDDQTQVLTDQGWKRWLDVTAEDLLATLNGNWQIEYQRPTALIMGEYRGKMYRVDSQHVDLLVTPNHNMFVCQTTTKVGRSRMSYRLVTAEELGHVSHAYMKSGEWAGGRADYLSYDEAAFLGFVIGDGHVHPSRLVAFHLKKERKISWLRGITARLGWTLVERGGQLYVTPPKTSPVYNLVEWVYNEDGEKRIPQQLLTDVCREVLEGLLEGLMQSDGHRGRTCDSFDTTSDELAGQFQQLCLHVGLAANVTYRYEDRPHSYGNKPLTRLTIIRRCLKPEVNRWADCEGRSSWVEDWHGIVYCAEVPNHTLYVRRNGKPVWCGNSVAEHLTINFLCADVPRSTQLETVRHRAGMAYSWESTRFTNKHTRFVVPPRLRDDLESRLFFEQSCRRAVQAYEELVSEADNPSDDGTLRRKRKLEAARSVLPNALGSDGMFTCNARSLRHFVELRTSEHADLSIREFAYAIYQAAKPWVPAILADATETEAREGTPIVSFTVSKV